MKRKINKDGKMCPLCGAVAVSASDKVYQKGLWAISASYFKCSRCFWQSHHDTWEERAVADAGNHKRQHHHSTHNLAD